MAVINSISRRVAIESQKFDWLWAELEFESRLAKDLLLFRLSPKALSYQRNQ